jgi:hypothetical protein
MQERAFGRTGLAVSALGFGSWPMSGGDRYGAHRGRGGDPRHLRSAASVLNTVPMLIAFIILRRRIMESVALTGLKG